MIDLKRELVQALRGNDILITLLGGDRIYRHITPNPEEFPRITYFEMSNVDNQFADDTAIGSEVIFQIDVWSKGDTTSIAQEVDRTMKAIDFWRYAGADLYEEDTKIYHKALRYRTNREIQEV